MNEGVKENWEYLYMALDAGLMAIAPKSPPRAVKALPMASVRSPFVVLLGECQSLPCSLGTKSCCQQDRKQYGCNLFIFCSHFDFELSPSSGTATTASTATTATTTISATATISSTTATVASGRTPAATCTVAA